MKTHRNHLFSNDTMGWLMPHNIGDPSTYDSETSLIYAKSDGNLYFNDTATQLNNTPVSQLTIDAPMQLMSYAFADIPAATTAGQMIYVSDAAGATVTGSACFSNGTIWVDVTTGVEGTD